VGVHGSPGGRPRREGRGNQTSVALLPGVHDTLTASNHCSDPSSHQGVNGQSVIVVVLSRCTPCCCVLAAPGMTDFPVHASRCEEHDSWSEMSVGVDRAVDQVLGAGDPQRVGSFRFFLDGERWEWSDVVAQMHGYAPGTIIPTTALLLSHKHPDDQPHVAKILRKMVDDAEPFSSRHRIIDTAGRTRQVIVVGNRMLDDTDAVIGTSGFYIDVTDTLDTDLQESVTEAVEELEKARAVIEQAKGALMLVYGISADRAFDVLTWRSQQTNIKLRAIATQLVQDFVSEVGSPSASFRARVDHLLITVHERIPRQ
jgi:PAS domain S-box-containing protein